MQYMPHIEPIQYIESSFEDKIRFINETLQQYAKENCCSVRSTMDMSPLEQWLLLQLYIQHILIKGEE